MQDSNLSVCEFPAVMNEQLAAEYVGLSVKTLQKYRHTQKAPSYIKLNKSVRYARTDLDAFLAENRVEPCRA